MLIIAQRINPANKYKGISHFRNLTKIKNWLLLKNQFINCSYFSKIGSG